MSVPSIDPAMLETVKEFVELLKNKPILIFQPELKFLRDYLAAVGAKLPKMPEPAEGGTKGSGDSAPKQEYPRKEPKVETFEEEMEMEPDEPFPELPQEGVIAEDDEDPSQDMGTDAEASEDAMEKSNELKREAVGLFGEEKWQECVAKYTEAIKLNGHAAVLFAKRGQAYLRLEKPNACIKDCTKALELNPDSAIGYKFRGRAHRLLGHWAEAAADLRQACKIDFDDQADEWLKEVQPNARKVEEWRIRKKLRDEEREIKQRKAKAQQRAQAHAAHTHEPSEEPDIDDFLGGMGGIMNDPEIATLLADPDVAAAFKEIGESPANILKYQNNPKVLKLIGLMQKKMGGMGMGMPGMGGGGMPGMGGGGMPGGFPMGGMPGGFPGGMPGGFPGGMPGGFPGMGGFGGGGAAPPQPPPPQTGGGPAPAAPKPAPGDDLD